MRIIAADANALAKGLERRPIGPGLHVVEADMLINEVADRLYSRPAAGRRIEQSAGEVSQLAVHLAVAAGQQKQQDFVR